MSVLPPSARIAVVGAGPGGLVTAKHALEAGFDVTVLEAADRVGGQWHTTGAQSGIWPGMRTNTSRAMTAFSDVPWSPELALHPYAEQVRDYLQRYADRSGVSDRVELGTRVDAVTPAGDGWRVDGRRFDAVVVASGRFRTPVVPRGLAAFDGPVLHAFDYPGKESSRGRRALVYGNGVSGHEIGSDIAEVAEQVVAAYRKPRYVLRKVVDGVSSDWQWYTHAAALQRTLLPRQEVARRLTEQVVAVAGRPQDFGAPAPDPDITVAGHSLAQSWLDLVQEGRIVCRPGIASVEGRTVTFTDGSSDTVDTVLCATGYALDVPFLPPEVWHVVGPDLRLHLRTLHPDLPGLAFVGQFALQGPYLPLLELQARLVVNTWSGVVPTDEEAARASTTAPPPQVDAHHVLALALAEGAGVSPDLDAHPELVEPLLFGPMLPPRYRLDGPGAFPGAAAELARQLATSPRAAVDPSTVADLPRLGLGHLAL